MGVERRRLLITGVVQGVGFRPFVYRRAVAGGLVGSVRNLGDAGVEVFVEGEEKDLDAFLSSLRSEQPPMARIASVTTERCEPVGEAAFTIVASDAVERTGGGSLPPDTGICDACTVDLLGTSRYRDYWATSCTDCGPRFTVIEGLPYDRPRTSMRDFPMCAACGQEYDDPLDRRHHAQTIACSACGPRLWFDRSTDRPIERAADALRDGRILAIKGLGGTHLACDASNPQAVGLLRGRLGRPEQPYAVMADEAMIDRFAAADAEERRLLRSPQRPIVLLAKTREGLPASIAPGLHTVGVMLPYTGLHVLLLERIDTPLVMTSANLPGRPMLVDNVEIEERLKGVADHVLLHDRRIVARCDDSVMRRSGGTTLFIRRSRGYVPESFRIDLGAETILATGPETGVTFALYEAGSLIVSQHIGSVDNLDTYAFFRGAIAHHARLTGVSKPAVYACDLHPRFLTSDYAREAAERHGGRVIRVQHHAAHLISVMAEQGLEEAVGIILDGIGHGLDGAAWGGEILAARDRMMDRVGSLEPIGLPGGDRGARYPLRAAAALLVAAGFDHGEIERQLFARGMPRQEAAAVLVQIEEGLNTPQTTSAGRFLDAVAAWLGVCRRRTYEGEPAMRLEAAAISGQDHAIAPRIRAANGRRLLDTVEAFGVLVEMAESHPVCDVAATAQAFLARGTAQMAVDVARERGIGTIALSGGVAYNDAISRAIRERVKRAGLSFATNEAVPPGDGGISFGQAVYAGQGWRMSDANRLDVTPSKDVGDGASTRE